MIHDVTVLVVGIGDFETGFQSGRPRAVLRAARETFERAEVLSLPSASVASRALAAGTRRGLRSGPFLAERTHCLSRKYGRRIQQEVNRVRPAFVLSTTSLPFAERISIPAVTWPDGPLNLMVDDGAYPTLNRLTDRARKRYLTLERNSIRNATIAAYPASRSSRAALQLAPTAEVRTYAFGPNLPVEILTRARNSRQTLGHKGLNLLFIGLDWERKGGQVAYETIRELARRDIPATLTIVGNCPAEVKADPLVIYLGRASGDTEGGKETLVSAFAAADVFVFPTRSDNFAAVVAEAASVGIPCFVSDRAGASEYVSRLGFGQVLPVSTGHDEILSYANALQAAHTTGALHGLGLRALEASKSELSYSGSLCRIYSDLRELAPSVGT